MHFPLEGVSCLTATAGVDDCDGCCEPLWISGLGLGLGLGLGVQTVLELAHEIPMAGHLGKEKTSRRILQRFYWPTLYKDVASFCRSCEQCQQSAKRGVSKASLLPLPIIGEPFQKIAMDIVGPIPRSRSENRYVLVICDYATRYPEAIALRRIHAERGLKCPKRYSPIKKVTLLPSCWLSYINFYTSTQSVPAPTIHKRMAL